MSSDQVMSLDQMNKIISGFIATMPIAQAIEVQALRDEYRMEAMSRGAAGTLAMISVGLELLETEIQNLAAELN